MSRTAQNQRFQRTADARERGDVIDMHGEYVVITVPSDTVATVPRDAVDVVLATWLGGGKPLRADQLCEPYFVRLGKTGRMTHEGSYFLARNSFRFDVVGFLDPDILSAVMEPHPCAP